MITPDTYKVSSTRRTAEKRHSSWCLRDSSSSRMISPPGAGSLSGNFSSAACAMPMDAAASPSVVIRCMCTPSEIPRECQQPPGAGPEMREFSHLEQAGAIGLIEPPVAHFGITGDRIGREPELEALQHGGF